MTQSLSKNRRGCCLKAAYNLDFDRTHDRDFEKEENYEIFTEIR